MADGNLFSVNLVTPERVLLTGSASEVILRTAEGDVTFLDGHAPLVGTVEPGVVRVVRSEGEVERVAVHGGFVQVDQALDPAGGEVDASSGEGTRVTLLVSVAERAEEIDTERARAALEGARGRVAGLTSSGGRSLGPGESDEPAAELAEAEAAVRRAEVRLEAADSTTPTSTTPTATTSTAS